MAGTADTLFLPFWNGELAVSEGAWLYLGAIAPERGFPDGVGEKLVCEQSMRGPFLDLKMRGLDVHSSVEINEPFDGVLVLIGKHRTENEAMIARAAAACPEGAPILVAGQKTSGIGSIKKRIAQIVDLEGSLAKNHATVIWFRNNSELRKIGSSSSFAMPDGFFTAPGMFSAEKVDKGSALLSKFIDSSVRGAVADFGAGWGFLSRTIIENGAASYLDLYEAHWPSLEAAKKNLPTSQKLRLGYNWHDVTREPIMRKYDTIIMNPPFHTGRKTEPALGERFIEVAAKCLKPKGKLILVANTGLPYEKVLSTQFRTTKTLEKSDGFKVLVGEK